MKRSFQSPIDGDLPYPCPKKEGCCTNTAANRPGQVLVAVRKSGPGNRPDACQGPSEDPLSGGIDSSGVQPCKRESGRDEPTGGCFGLRLPVFGDRMTRFHEKMTLLFGDTAIFTLDWLDDVVIVPGK
jgi:hypothetical protein